MVEKLTDYFRIMFPFILEKKMAPPLVSRTEFIFSSIIYNGYSYVAKIKNTDGYIPSFKFYIDYCDKFLYINYLALISLKLLNSTYPSTVLTEFIIKKTNELDNNPKYLGFLVQYTQQLATVEKELRDYYNYRNTDGWIQGNDQVVIPNSQYRIDPYNKINTSLIVENSWCQVAKNKQWAALVGEIRGLFSLEVVNKLKEDAYAYYKTLNLKQLMNEVLNVSLNLNEKEKMTAEFWGGGNAGVGDSVTPPAYFIYFYICYLDNHYLDVVKQFTYYHMISCGLFQSSIITWGVKFKLLDPRPIQSIRINNPDTPINYYFGESNTNIWQPYQTSVSWTPPFPDFYSGHSCFSNVASTILTELLGEDIIDKDINLVPNELWWLTLNYPKDYNVPTKLTNIILPKDSSKVIPNTPTVPTNIGPFTTWNELSENAAQSRIYGGIHHRGSKEYGSIIGKEIARLTIDYFLS
jgi:hypothetical protein